MSNVLQILKPSVVKGWWSEVLTPFQLFQDFFKMGTGGERCEMSDTRSVSIDVVDSDRKISGGRAAGASAAVVAPRVIGSRPTNAPRTFEKIALSYELLNNIREIGENAGTLDKRGVQYVKSQLGYLAERGRLWRENLIWGMLRGTLKFNIVGTDWVPVSPDAVSASHTVDWQMPADHKNQAGGIISASWNTTTTPILEHLAALLAKSEADTGMPIQHAWCNHVRWQKILNNDQIRETGGTANTPFEEYLFEVMRAEGKAPSNINMSAGVTTGKLKGFPQLTWHVTDRVVNIDDGTGTFSNRKYLGDDEVFLHPSLDYDWCKMWEVKETTNQGYGQEPTDVFGFDTWIKRPLDSDTAEYILYMLDNCFPACNPKAGFNLDVTP